jgi:hypothetical protein
MNKNIIYVCIILIFASCELADGLKPFNGKIFIVVENINNRIMHKHDTIVFSVEVPLEITNTINKKVKFFKKEDLKAITLFLSITQKNNVLLNQNDFEVFQELPYFNEGNINPIWNDAKKVFEANFKLRFKKEGIYKIKSSGSFLNKGNSLFSEKGLSPDFDIESRNLALIEAFEDDLTIRDRYSDNPKDDLKNSIGGLFYLEVK